jgi:hypothetical protein
VITAQDKTLAQKPESRLVVTSGAEFTMLDGGSLASTLEAGSTINCSELFGSGNGVFRNISIFTPKGTTRVRYYPEVHADNAGDHPNSCQAHVLDANGTKGSVDLKWNA